MRATLVGIVMASTLIACSAPGAAPATVTPSQAPAASAVASPSPLESTSSGGGRGDYDYPDPVGASSPVASTPVSTATVEVGTATGPLGEYLTGLDDLTLYTFKPDSENTSTCDGGCADAWPPFTVEPDATLEAGAGVDGELTTFARVDGTLQVAYNGAPLYYFAQDTSAGDTNGQGLGDNWFVAKP